jgi:hypothetical protein
MEIAEKGVDKSRPMRTDAMVCNDRNLRWGRKSMRKLFLCCVLVLLAAIPSFAGTVNVLYWWDYSYPSNVVPGAIALAGATGTMATDQNDFNTKLAAGGWDVVIFGEQNQGGDVIWNGSSAQITAYVAGGGKVIGATWLNGGMAAYFGATSFVSSDGLFITTDANPIFTGLGPTIGLFNPGWGIYSMGFGTGATCAGTLDGGGCGALIANGGLTILNAALFDTYMPQADGERLIANEILLLSGTQAPEPASLLLLGAGLTCLLAFRRK